MDRSLQSALDKRSRVGSWQSRVYRLERGYLSAWPDVTSAAAKEAPSKTECLFQDGQVAVVTDQGDRRFRLDFPWDSTKTLSLRANNLSMKKSWMEVLTKTLKEASSQIKDTGSVFALGGAAQHREDEAYEEAAYLKTNRFLAAYVVDESNRASYVNDHLNESFKQEEGVGMEGSLRACAGACAVVDEFLALVEDFKQEILGVEELRAGGGGDDLGGLDPVVAAPKIRRFCEEHVALTGRLIASRLMLELAPFMDSSVAGTPAAPTSATRGELVSTRRRLDEMYTTTERLVLPGRHDWLMDIRSGFLDCSGLLQATSPPPTPPPAVEDDTYVAMKPPRVAATTSGPVSTHPLTPNEEPAPPRRSSKMLLASAVSAAMAATKGSFKGGVLAAREDGDGSRVASSTSGSDAPAKDSANVAAMSSVSSLLAGSGLSMRAFRRGSKNTEKGGEENDVQSPVRSPRQSPRRARARSPRRAEKGLSVGIDSPTRDYKPTSDTVLSGEVAKEKGGSDPFSGVTSHPSGSPSRPGQSPTSSSRNLFAKSSKLPDCDPATLAVADPGPVPAGRVNPASTDRVQPKSDTAQSSVTCNSPSNTGGGGGGGRKGRRAFAGGLWNGAGGADNPPRKNIANVNTETMGGQTQTTTNVPPTISSTQIPPTGHAGTAGTVALSVAGGKKRFAGGQTISGTVPGETSAVVGGCEGRRGATDAASRREDSRSWETPKPAETEGSTPAWATGNDARGSDAVPDWARDAGGGGDMSAYMTRDGNSSASLGLAPPSRPGRERQDEVGKMSPMLAPDAEIPASRPNPQRMRGGASSGGSRRAFGGGAALF